MEDYFISRLFGKNVARLPIEWIADDTFAGKMYEKECSTTISSSDRKNCWPTFVSLWYGIHCIQINGWNG